uniref:Ribosomal protein S3 n=1 Tax=Beauveria malawiensis TaxID=371061 RepID=A0A190XCV1_9HYPO|nr:ribosomal protein S3 [Beauveria malawiensis]AMD61734.1 ribosomal protein S3 [Beauveria malawiensis]
MKTNTTLRRKLHIILSKVPQKITLNNKIADIRKTKYLPSFSEEWKDTIYSYNKNTIKNIPSHHLNIHKIIQSYFNLYFSTKKNNNKRFIYPGKYITMKRRRNLLRKIYVSNPDIQYTNNKAIITLFTLNRERNYLFKKYVKVNKKIQSYLMQRYLFLYKNNIINLYNVFEGTNFSLLSKLKLWNKNKFIQYKLKYLSKFLLLKNLYLKKVWSRIIKTFLKRHLIFLRKYELLYSLNQLKFNKLTLLNKLSLLLNKILGKKIEYNIINLKSIIFNSDLFTQALALKLKKIKSFNYKKNILSILGRVNFPDTNLTHTEGGNYILNKYKDGKILSYLSLFSDFYSLRRKKNSASYKYRTSAWARPKSINNHQNLDKFIAYTQTHCNNQTIENNTNKNIHKEIFNSIQYKNIEGIKIETNGRLTKRYRADRSVHYRKWKGGLQKTSLHSTLFRGNVNPNISYSIANNTRRVGSFAIKGWISGK